MLIYVAIKIAVVLNITGFLCSYKKNSTISRLISVVRQYIGHELKILCL